MKDMIQRRTLLSALPFAFLAACTRAEAGRQPSQPTSADMTGMTGEALVDLVGGVGKVAWLTLAGTVRLKAGNDNVRQATLHRALTLTDNGSAARVFDVWQIAGGPALAGPSVTSGTGRSEIGSNDLGVASVWLKRHFSHSALQTPIESSRLAREDARVMAIDATQIWLLEGGAAPNAPALTGADLAAFEAWRVG
jgi:hypothetical protein